MDDRVWGILGGLTLMAIIAPFALRGFRQRMREYTGRDASPPEASNDGTGPG